MDRLSIPLQRHWRCTRRLTTALLAVWFVVTFGGAWFARDLTTAFNGWPFSFWLAAQGALIVYALLVWGYARAMARLDRAHRPAGDE